MTASPIYVPVLKGKEGEFAALEVLKQDARSAMMPLIEVPDVPYDYVNERPSKSLDEHIAGIADRLRKCWPDRPLYLDLPWFGDEEHLESGRVALDAVLSDCQKRGIQVVPVVSRRNSNEYLTAAGKHLYIGGCVRLMIEDFEEDVDLDIEIDKLLGGLGNATASSLDLILDLEDLGTEVGRAVLVTRSMFSMIPSKNEWRHIVLIATSFPEDLRNVGPATVSELPRREWELWKTLQKRPNALPRRDLIFGDYAITHPTPKEIDPRIMLMSANIRYTTTDNWLVVKGRNVRQYGFEQYFELCRELVNRQEYSGSGFSWGDRYIHDCAASITGPGNATTWRKVGTNHHISLVAQEVANLSFAS